MFDKEFDKEIVKEIVRKSEVQTLQTVIEAAFALLMIGLWIYNGCRLPKYVHWMAATAFLFGGYACYEVISLGAGIVSVLWVPFLFAGIVYVVFILHGVGLPSEAELKQAAKKQQETEKDEEDAEE